MGTRFHMCENIKGLMSLSDYRLKKMACCFEVDGVPLRTAAQVRRELRKMQAEGMECVPSVGCDNYDSKGRCLGHPRKENAHEQANNG